METTEATENVVLQPGDGYKYVLTSSEKIRSFKSIESREDQIAYMKENFDQCTEAAKAFTKITIRTEDGTFFSIKAPEKIAAHNGLGTADEKRKYLLENFDSKLTREDQLEAKKLVC
jgi:hypothetical protein